MNMRADAEEVPVIDVLRTLASEMVDCDNTVKKLAGEDCELASVWSQYVQVSVVARFPHIEVVFNLLKCRFRERWSSTLTPVAIACSN